MVRFKATQNLFNITAFNDPKDEESNRITLGLASDEGIRLLVADVIKLAGIKNRKTEKLLGLISNMEEILRGRLIRIKYFPYLNDLDLFIGADGFSVRCYFKKAGNSSLDVYLRILVNLLEGFNLPIPILEIIETLKDLEKDLANTLNRRYVKFELSSGSDLKDGFYIIFHFSGNFAHMFELGIKDETLVDKALSVLNIDPEAKNLPKTFKLLYPFEDEVSFTITTIKDLKAILINELILLGNREVEYDDFRI